jgi:hypothetical protein
LNIGKRLACSHHEKRAAIDDGAAERRAVAAHEFGQRMHDDVGAVVDRFQQDRGRHRIVDDEWHTVAVRNFRQGLNVADIAGRIADALAEHGTGVAVDQRLDRLGAIGFSKADLDALARQHVREQRVGGAVKLRYRDDVGAHGGKIEHGIIQRRLPGRDAERVDAAFERRDPALQHRRRRIGDPRIAEAFDLEVEQSGAVIGAVEFIGHGLVDRHRDGLGRRVGLVAAVDSHGLVFHRFATHPEIRSNCK